MAEDTTTIAVLATMHGNHADDNYGFHSNTHSDAVVMETEVTMASQPLPVCLLLQHLPSASALSICLHLLKDVLQCFDPTAGTYLQGQIISSCSICSNMAFLRLKAVW